ncbi:hypothetical protein BC939DRAFT_455825 [Gamsiella multidivaricata]|uniref:uncharacterized protein n=1 Tax=Gamsiella multidivaricata TaxID=101098 RepID=UPI00221F2EEC|nr:uncharacterized protein BC939DRAFT_455825 [Gamsiella multidivaricata]KAG0363121.1 hypothetical protein BGZ54_008308 [Gamsiella multidivaricata]KAI7821370.1 hypothetical protein BC939DRAFT_455825 [Gamsiella multidivaricata]
MRLQKMLQNLLHPPPLAVLILVLSIIFLLPHRHQQWILSLVESALGFDLTTAFEALPSSEQTLSTLFYYKARVLDPLARILLGWEPEDHHDSDNVHTGFGGPSLYPLPEHRNATRTNLPDRAKITSRAQLHQLRNGDANQGISAALDAARSPTPLAPRYVHGLVNTGNSCFLNSVLQALSALSVLSPYLESILGRSDDLRMDEDDVQVTEALLDTIEALQHPLVTHKSFRPRAIVYALEASRAKDSKSSGYHTNIMNREQQDAQELFQMISSALSSEEAAVQRSLATRPLIDLDFIKQLLGLGPKPNQHQVRKMDSNPMIGMLASRLSCMQCGYTEAIRHFTFDNLSLSLPSYHSCTIEDCLKQYINLESLHDVVCRKCSLNATLTRVGNELRQLDGHQLPQPPKISRRRVYQDLDSSLSEQSSDCYSETGESSVLDDSEDEMAEARRPLQLQTKGERMALKSKLIQQRAVLESAIKSDVEKALPDIKLTRVISRHCTKQVMLAKPPPVLCLHFVRSQYSNYGTVSKNSCQVNFPEYLDVSPFCTTGVLLTQPNLPMSISEQDMQRLGHDAQSKPSPKNKRAKQQKKQRQQQQQQQNQQKEQKEQDEQGQRSQPRVLYRLQSIVVHYGGHSYGHFIAYRRKPENMQSKVGAVGLGLDPMTASRAGSLYGGSGRVEDWFRISDETVESVTLDHVLRSNPYMCLYEKVETQEEKMGRDRGELRPSLSLQAVELGFRNLLKKKLGTWDDEEGMGKKLKADVSSDSSRVDLAAITEKEYAELFREQPKAMSALSRISSLEHGEDMSDTESIHSHDEDRPWRSFVSSPNSTTPPSPNTGSSDSSASSSSYTSPILMQRSKQRLLSLGSLKTVPDSIPDLDLVLDTPNALTLSSSSTSISGLSMTSNKSLQSTSTGHSSSRAKSNSKGRKRK